MADEQPVQAALKTGLVERKDKPTTPKPTRPNLTQWSNQMSFFNKAAVSSAVIATGVAFMIAASGSVYAAPATNLTAGDACTVKSGPNKGKTGTYGADGWCEGDWGGTECGGTKCKVVAKSTGGVNARTTAPARGKSAAQLKLKRSSTFGSKVFSASR